MSTIKNEVSRTHYSNLVFLFDLLKPSLNDIELLIEEDEDEYRKLLKTTVVSANTNEKFPEITKKDQELIGDIVRERLAFDTVSTV